MSNATKKAQPYECKLTAVSMSFRGAKINAFLMLPVINGRPTLPLDVQEAMEKAIGATRGDTIAIG